MKDESNNSRRQKLRLHLTDDRVNDFFRTADFRDIDLASVSLRRRVRKTDFHGNERHCSNGTDA